MKRIVAVVAMVLVALALAMPAAGQEMERGQFEGLHGADVWALDVTIRGPDPVGYWYLPGKLYKSQLRQTFQLVYGDQGLDIFIFTEATLVHCYYLSDQSVATAIIMPR